MDGDVRKQNCIFAIKHERELKELKRVVMKMHIESINILAEKRAALKAGDDAMVRAMGEGKDIMSILRQLSYLF